MNVSSLLAFVHHSRVHISFSGKRRYNVKLWKTFTECFNCLPIAAIIDEKIFCMHGGLSPDLKAMEQIRRIVRPTDVPDTGTRSILTSHSSVSHVHYLAPTLPPSLSHCSSWDCLLTPICFQGCFAIFCGRIPTKTFKVGARTIEEFLSHSEATLFPTSSKDTILI
jgi:hypothetical protein